MVLGFGGGEHERVVSARDVRPGGAARRRERVHAWGRARTKPDRLAPTSPAVAPPIESTAADDALRPQAGHAGAHRQTRFTVHVQRGSKLRRIMRHRLARDRALRDPRTACAMKSWRQNGSSAAGHPVAPDRSCLSLGSILRCSFQLSRAGPWTVVQVTHLCA